MTAGGGGSASGPCMCDPENVEYQSLHREAHLLCSPDW